MKKELSYFQQAEQNIRACFRKGLFLSAEGKEIVSELSFFSEDLLKFICLGKPETRQEFERLVNAFRAVHQKIESDEKYFLGKAKEMFSDERKTDTGMFVFHGRSESGNKSSVG